jgi:hypothetical protein
MSVMASLAKVATDAKVPTGTRRTTRVLPKTKWKLVVALALVTVAVLITASKATNAEHYSSCCSRFVYSVLMALALPHEGWLPRGSSACPARSACLP